MKPRDIITAARLTLNDKDAIHNSDLELLKYVNLAICECSTLAPQLFYSTGDMLCSPGETEQGVVFADAQLVIEVIGIKDGPAILLGDMATLSAFDPNWRQRPAGIPENWFKHPLDPLRFYLSRKALPNQVIEVKYVRSPQPVAIDDELTDLPPSMEPALVQYVIGMAEAKDAAHVNSGRAQAFLQAFVAKLNVKSA